MNKKRRSRLTPLQQRALIVVVSLGIFMIADTLYLLVNRLGELLEIGYFAATAVSLPKFYQGMVLSHTAVGLILVLIAMLFVLWHLPAVWRKSRKRAILTGLFTVIHGLSTVTKYLILLSYN